MHKPFGAALLAAALSFSGAALADAPPGPDSDMPGPPPGPPPGGLFSPRQMCEAGDATVAGLLTFAEVRLKITPDEQAAWSRFKQAAQGSLASFQKTCAELPKRRPAQPPKLPDRLASMERMMTAHLDQLRQMRAAVADLYPALTADQQQLADRLLDGPPR